jgi:mono/diheme cytochrome c family protein
MKHSTIRAALVGAAVVCATSTAFAQAKPQSPKFDYGAQEYRSSCAACHGLTGKGDGPYSGYLSQSAKSPSDLTTLAKRNGGVFPVQRVYEIIDGRQTVPAHGARDMPIWGARYLDEAGRYYFDSPYDAEAFIRNRIVWLVDYLNRLQVK